MYMRSNSHNFLFFGTKKPRFGPPSKTTFQKPGALGGPLTKACLDLVPTTRAMSSVSSMISKFDGAQGGSSNDALLRKSPSLSDQFGKEKVPEILTADEPTDAVEGKVLVSPERSLESEDEKKHARTSKDKGGILPPKDEPSVSVPELNESRKQSSVFSTYKNSGQSNDKDDGSNDQNANNSSSQSDDVYVLNSKPDPSGARSPIATTTDTVPATPTKKYASPSGGKKMIRKTAIKASDLGIDLESVSKEALNEAVKKWKAEQAAATKPDPSGANSRTPTRGCGDPPSIRPRSKSRARTPGKDRSKSRSKSRGRDRDATPTRSGSSRARPKSRSRAKQDDESLNSREEGWSKSKPISLTPRTVKKKLALANGVTDTTPSPGKVKRKIIVRRRASLTGPPRVMDDVLERKAPERQGSHDDMFDILSKSSAASAPPPVPIPITSRILSDMKASRHKTEQGSTELSDKESNGSQTKIASPNSSNHEAKASPISSPRQTLSAEVCVENVLDGVPTSPSRFQRRAAMPGAPEVNQFRALSRGRMAKARSDVAEIQKRLRQAGISDEQYRSMLSAGLSVTIA